MDPNALAAYAAVAGVIVSILVAVNEGKRSRSAHHADMVMNLNDRFNDAQMKKKRLFASEFLLENRGVRIDDPRWGQVSDVIDFFQILGTFVKAGNVSHELIYKFFYYWLSHYWTACSAYIEHTRKNSPITWNDAEWLYQELRAFDLKENVGSLSRLSAKQFDDFFKWELENLRI